MDFFISLYQTLLVLTVKFLRKFLDVGSYVVYTNGDSCLLSSPLPYFSSCLGTRARVIAVRDLSSPGPNLGGLHLKFSWKPGVCCVCSSCLSPVKVALVSLIIQESLP